MVKKSKRIRGSIIGFDSIIPVIRTSKGDFYVYQLSLNGNAGRKMYEAYIGLKIGDVVEATFVNQYLMWAEFMCLYKAKR